MKSGKKQMLSFADDLYNAIDQYQRTAWHRDLWTVAALRRGLKSSRCCGVLQDLTLCTPRIDIGYLVSESTTWRGGQKHRAGRVLLLLKGSDDSNNKWAGRIEWESFGRMWGQKQVGTQCPELSGRQNVRWLVLRFPFWWLLVTMILILVYPFFSLSLSLSLWRLASLDLSFPLVPSNTWQFIFINLLDQWHIPFILICLLDVSHYLYSSMFYNTSMIFSTCTLDSHLSGLLLYNIIQIQHWL